MAWEQRIKNKEKATPSFCHSEREETLLETFRFEERLLSRPWGECVLALCVCSS
jgi:hypothetical protein